MKTGSSSAPPEKPTKSGSGSRDEDAAAPLIRQSTWRKAGLGALAGAALMAWFGAESLFVRESVWHLLIYWSICLGLLAVAGYTVILDLRYIRLQYALGRRRVFTQTLGDEAFRKTLLSARTRGRSGRNGPGKMSP